MELAATQQEILLRLKSRGPQSIKILANQLHITTMGIRQHIAELAQRGFVAQTAETRQTRGRPVHFWQLTELGHQRFPDSHAETSLQLIHSVRESLGESALHKLVVEGFAAQQERYRQALAAAGDELEARLACLADLRSADGFMAEIRLSPNGWLLIENHCPIYAAANACGAYCDAELSMFKSLLADKAEVQRTDHAIAGSRRCAYKITSL